MASNTNTNNHSSSTPKVDGYKLNQLIGKGSYGQVFRAEKLGSTDSYAIKCIPLKSLSKNSRNNIISEIAILKNLKHDFIVQMLDFQWDKAFVYLVFEFCAGGELASIIRLRRSFPEEIVQHFLQQLASAMKYLRENNVVHLDLKPQNILITGIQFVRLLNSLQSFNIWRHVILKIADFGFAQYLDSNESIDSLRGSPLYMAPEIFKRQKYDARADLWSIGIILFECLFGRTPLHGMSTAQITQSFRNDQFKINLPVDAISQICYELLKGLLKIDPEKRISFSNFFSHPFIDLEHMPTKESFQKASDILKTGEEQELSGNFKSAFYHFREALLYLMPIYRWGVPSQPTSKSKHKELQSIIVKYMDKAEDLQQKCGLVNISPKMLKQIQSVYNMIDRARDLESKDLHSKSLEKYEIAIEKTFDMLGCLDSKLKGEFFGELQDWITEAEKVKEKIDTEKKEFESSKTIKSADVESKPIVAEDAVKLFATESNPKPDWYLKLKEPSKSNLNAHSKLKHIEIVQRNDELQNPREPSCFVQ
ncbi:AF-9-like protein [Sarcoptes scabiei]|nr:AF-9-like protein [Sarcoptes scabiei]